MGKGASTQYPQRKSPGDKKDYLETIVNTNRPASLLAKTVWNIFCSFPYGCSPSQFKVLGLIFKALNDCFST